MVSRRHTGESGGDLSDDAAQGTTRRRKVVVVDRVPVRRSLVLWSGGLDSTYVLLRLLRESRDKVIAHHVSLRTWSTHGNAPSLRDAFEDRAIDRMAAWLAAHERPFTLTRSALDLSLLKAYGRDSTIGLFLGAQAALDQGLGPEDRIFIGINADDDGARWAPGAAERKAREAQALGLLEAVYESADVPGICIFEPRPTRQEEAAFLPPELLAMTASCRRPQNDGAGGFVPCGDCVPCMALAGLKGVAGTAGRENKPMGVSA